MPSVNRFATFDPAYFAAEHGPDFLSKTFTLQASSDKGETIYEFREVRPYLNDRGEVVLDTRTAVYCVRKIHQWRAG